MNAQQIRIGKIIGCHGLRGDLKVRPASDEALWAGSLKHVTLKDEKTGREQALKITGTRLQGPLVVLRFEGFPDRTAVEPLVGAYLYASLADLPEPEEGEFWVDDVIGLSVIDAQTGRKRGVVKDLLSSGGSDFLEIKLEESPETVVIPFIDQFFPEVNIEEKTILVDLLSDFLSVSNVPVTADKLEQ